MTQPSSKFSTTVRFFSWAARVGEWLAPGWTVEQAFRRFGRPQRHASRWHLAPERTATLEAGGFPVVTYEWNVGAAEAALLVHGWSGNAGQLRSFVEPLLARGLHVVAVDLPAHGASPGDFAAIPVFAEVAAAMIRRVQPRLVVAHSLGATGVVLALARGLRVPRVALLAPPLQAAPFVLQFAAAAGLSPAMTARLRARVDAYVGGLETVDLRRHAGRLGHLAALVVHDRDDAVVPLRSAEALVAHWPGAVLHETRGLSHDRIRHAPEVVSGVVAWALGTTDARVSAG